MTDFLLLAFVFLVAGVISVPIASRLGLGSVLGYLLAGIAISPILGWLGVDVVSIQHFAEFGVVMMLFLVGLELEPPVLWRMRDKLIGLGGLQVTLTMLIVAGIAMAFGLTWSVALATGMILALSSTAIIVQTLNEKGLMQSDGGQSSFSVLLFQDIAVIPMLALLPLLAMPELMGPGAEAGHAADAAHAAGDHGGDGDHEPALSLVAGLPGWQAGLVTIGAILAVIFIGRRLTAPIFRFIAMARLRELFTATALMIVIGIALLMSLVGLSPALGTFLAGVTLAASEYRHELESDIDPFRGLLLGLFFMTVGAGINFALLAEQFLLIAGLTLGLMALKAAILLALSAPFKVRGTGRWLFALSLAQAGEFGFVLISFTLANSVIPQAVADQLLLVVALSMLLTPLLFILYERMIAPMMSKGVEREADDIDSPGEIIIAGQGRFGGIINRILRGAGFDTTVIDYSSEHLEIMRTFGFRAYYGDATRPDLLTAAGIERAKLLVIAIDNKAKITELARYVIQNHPHVHVTARAIDRHHVYELWAAGCRDIIRETYDSSLRASRSALEALGVERAHAEMMVEDFNEMDRAAMVELANIYRDDIPAHQNKAYVAKAMEMREQWEADLQGRMKASRERGLAGDGEADKT